MNWQSIETAPRNTPVLVWAPNARADCDGHFAGDELPVIAVLKDKNAYFRKYDPSYGWREEWEWRSDLVEFESGWESTGSYTVEIRLQPTHWMPLPAGPA